MLLRSSAMTSPPPGAMRDREVELHHFVGGEWVRGDGVQIERRNPACPSEVVGHYAAATAGLLQRALETASRVEQEWDQWGLVRRGRVLRRVAEALERRREEIARLVTREEGKTLAEALAEVELSVETLHYHGARGRGGDGTTFPSSRDDELIRTVRRPLGTVAVITPWNFPVQIPVWKIAPALLWGNCVVWKPASHSVATATALAEVFAEADLPAGVLNVLLAPGALGAALASSDAVAGVSFTGSLEVGRSLASRLVERGTKLQLELGGHNAALVLPDADPTHAAALIVSGATGGTGQKCTATRRVIAVGAAYDPLVREVSESISALRVGDGALPTTDVGPLVSSEARTYIAQQTELALAEGAEIAAQAPVADAVVASGGYFLAPTVLLGEPSLKICQEEVFGPVVTVLRAGSIDEAISLANGTPYGLTASVFTSDEVSVRRCIRDIKAGIIKINAPTTGTELHVPFGGLKASSLPSPREQNSDTAAEFFTVTKSIYIRTAPS